MRIDAAGLTSRYSRGNSLSTIDKHGKVGPFPPFRIMPIEGEANARTRRYILRRQIDEMDSETNLSRVVVVARSPLVHPSNGFSPQPKVRCAASSRSGWCASFD